MVDREVKRLEKDIEIKKLELKVLELKKELAEKKGEVTIIIEQIPPRQPCPGYVDPWELARGPVVHY